MPTFFKRLRLCLTVATAGVIVVLTMSATVRAAEERPPVAIVHATSGRALIGRDFADPFVLRDRGVYYAYATGAGERHVQAARSRDLGSWSTLPDALPRLPAWASKQKGVTWAPSVLRRKSGYVLYYTTRDASSGFQCISRATSARPGGPYVDESKEAFICQVGPETPFCGSIDPSPVVDQGRAYLLWKSDENSASCRTAPRIWAQPLSDDGLTLVDSPVALLSMDRSWERPIVEGPSMVSYGGLYFLFYSANWYESARYAIGYATCDGPLGPCEKVTTEAPLLASHGAALGPGGQEFFTDARGLTWMAYHAWTAPHTAYAEGGARVLRLARVTFSTTRAPVVNTSVPPRADTRRRPEAKARARPRTS
jgi:beta-xylosidase